MLGFWSARSANTTDVLGGKVGFQAAATLKPSMPGITASSKITSGSDRRARLSADSPSVATSTV